MHQSKARAGSVTTRAVWLAKWSNGQRLSVSQLQPHTYTTANLSDGLHVLGGRSAAEKNEGQKLYPAMPSKLHTRDQELVTCGGAGSPAIQGSRSCRECERVREPFRC